MTEWERYERRRELASLLTEGERSDVKHDPGPPRCTWCECGSCEGGYFEKDVSRAAPRPS